MVIRLDYIRVRGAKENNLKNISIDLPRNQLIVITGLSGSGKSSLAFNTIYAEGHRRYVESLSAYARQFLGQLDKPKVESIEGLSPTIAIDQKTTSKNPRSTVGTITEIYDHLRLLYARAGSVFCPNGHGEINAQTVEEIVDQMMNLPEGTKLQILSPVVRGKKGEHTNTVKDMMAQGFVRARINGELIELHDDIKLEKNKKHSIEAIVDRIKIKSGIETRLSESVELALKAGNGLVIALTDDGEKLYSQNHSCKECGFSFEEIEPRTFSFNSPFGMCHSCNGIGETLEPVIEKIVFPNRTIKTDCFPDLMRSRYYREILFAFCNAHDIPLDVKFKDLPKEHQQILLYGSSIPFVLRYKNMMGRINEHRFPSGLGGITKMLKMKHLEKQNDSDDSNKSIEEVPSDIFEFVTCKECHGSRLKNEVLFVTVMDKNIHEVCQLPIDQALLFFQNLSLSPMKMKIVEQVSKEITSRLQFLNEVGLNYLTLARTSGTLSGGESQRIRLATQIGAGLTGVLYVLDEPSIGLHQRDNERLLESLKRLRDLGNTLIVVEHDEDTMRMADYIVDIGPFSGEHGGEIVAEGTFKEILSSNSLTSDYLSGRKRINIPKKRREPKDAITVVEASENNLKNVTVQFPLGVLCSVTGVSGSGKSTLVNQILYRSLASRFYKHAETPGRHKSIQNIEAIDKIINIDQSPIGRTPRSNPATYIGMFDDIRSLYSQTTESKVRGYKIGRFSFNVPTRNGGGRCEKCTGDGLIKIEMHFLSDVFVLCDVCKGKRYGKETLEIRYKGNNIHDVLNMTVEEALLFFENIPKIKRKLETLSAVGLGYIRLGQSATTLSGGEAQRIKLANELSKRSTGKTLYLLDEPTTGLHIHDVHNLLKVLEQLVEKGNTVLVIEHNLDVIKYSDYVIDLGPEGGNGGGTVIATGTPEEIAEVKESHTGHFLKKMLK